MKESALIVVAKQPKAGDTKTRLCPPLTLEMAAELYWCLLVDTLALVEKVEGADLTVAYAPEGSHDFFRRTTDGRFRLVAQRGANLGERLAYALGEHFALGYRRVVIMNSDGPTLPLAYLKDSLSALERADVTLGIGHDGGYYLIGMKRLHRALFEGIEWSTSTVIPQTLAICRRLGLRVHTLPEWYDVDVAADLERLWYDLEAGPQVAPRSWTFLQSLSPDLRPDR